VPLRTGIGSAHDPVGTRSKDAQAFYDQGLAYLHSYVWLEAARSFNQALKLDSNLAIAHAMLSIAYTELNVPADARAALARATMLAADASEHDRRHIDARIDAPSHAADCRRFMPTPLSARIVPRPTATRRAAVAPNVNRNPAFRTSSGSPTASNAPATAHACQGTVLWSNSRASK